MTTATIPWIKNPVNQLGNASSDLKECDIEIVECNNNGQCDPCVHHGEKQTT